MWVRISVDFLDLGRGAEVVVVVGWMSCIGVVMVGWVGRFYMLSRMRSRGF